MHYYRDGTLRGSARLDCRAVESISFHLDMDVRVAMYFDRRSEDPV